MPSDQSIEGAMNFVPTAEQLHLDQREVGTPARLCVFPVNYETTDLSDMEGYVDVSEVSTDAIARAEKAQAKLVELGEVNQNTPEYKLWQTVFENAQAEAQQAKEVNAHLVDRFRWKVVYRELIEVVLREDKRVQGFEFQTFGEDLLVHLRDNGLENYELEIDGVLTRATIPEFPRNERVQFEPVEQA